MYKTVEAIYRADVASSGIFSKGRSPVLDKLLLFPVRRYLRTSLLWMAVIALMAFLTEVKNILISINDPSLTVEKSVY